MVPVETKELALLENVQQRFRDSEVCFMSLLTQKKKSHNISDFIQTHKQEQRAPTSDRHGP